MPSKLALRTGQVAIEVDDSGAVYPVTVDPVFTIETKLTASDAAAGDQFGFSVALSGETAVVGALLDHDAGFASGSAYVFELPLTTENYKILGSHSNFLFGATVSISENVAEIGREAPSLHPRSSDSMALLGHWRAI